MEYSKLLHRDSLIKQSTIDAISTKIKNIIDAKNKSYPISDITLDTIKNIVLMELAQCYIKRMEPSFGDKTAGSKLSKQSKYSIN